MGEIRLAGDRAERGEFRRREPHHVVGILLRIGHAVEFGLLGGVRPFHGAAELQGLGFRCFARLFRHDAVSVAQLIDNRHVNVTHEAAFSALNPCCRSSANRSNPDFCPDI